jgi:3-deoxy-D-manno-octulosonate 8-phosphate phosphatase KdsC-like HAD superfamily phosphatase
VILQVPKDKASPSEFTELRVVATAEVGLMGDEADDLPAPGPAGESTAPANAHEWCAGRSCT